MNGFEYLEFKNDFENLVYSKIPEVTPDWLVHDGWNGAAGVEHRDGWYEPYPHNWDSTLGWCRIKWRMMLHDINAKEFSINMSINDDPYSEDEDIPMQLFGRAISRWW